MANDPSGDSNCKAWFRFESGSLRREEITNNNTFLTDNNTVQENTADPDEGGCAALCSDTNNEYFSVIDASLPAGFPFKSGVTLTGFSWFARVKTPSSLTKSLWSKFDTASGGGMYSFLASSKLFIRLYEGSNIYEISFGTNFSTDSWYRVVFSLNFSTLAFVLRIYDVGAAGLLGADKTGTSTRTPGANTGVLQLGKGSTGAEWDSSIDEWMFFDDVLTSDEMDQLIAGTYSPGGSSIVPINPITRRSRFFRGAS